MSWCKGQLVYMFLMVLRWVRAGAKLDSSLCEALDQQEPAPLWKP